MPIRNLTKIHTDCGIYRLTHSMSLICEQNCIRKLWTPSLANALLSLCQIQQGLRRVGGRTVVWARIEFTMPFVCHMLVHVLDNVLFRSLRKLDKVSVKDLKKICRWKVIHFNVVVVCFNVVVSLKLVLQTYWLYNINYYNISIHLLVIP